MRQANGCPLPDGVKFFIWPRYVLSVHGIEVRLSRYRARILMFLMSRPETLFNTREIARAIYWDREDGGAWTTESIIPKQVFDLHRVCRAAGVELHLKKPGGSARLRLHGHRSDGSGGQGSRIPNRRRREYAAAPGRAAAVKRVGEGEEGDEGCPANREGQQGEEAEEGARHLPPSGYVRG